MVRLNMLSMSALPYGCPLSDPLTHCYLLLVSRTECVVASLLSPHFLSDMVIIARMIASHVPGLTPHRTAISSCQTISHQPTLSLSHSLSLSLNEGLKQGVFSKCPREETGG
jgi:hypothetical protein